MVVYISMHQAQFLHMRHDHFIFVCVTWKTPFHVRDMKDSHFDASHLIPAQKKWHTTCFKFISMRDITHSHCCLYMCIDASHLIPANKTYLFHSCIWDMTHSHFDASHLNPANKTYLFHTSIWDMTHSHFDASPLNPPFLCNFYALDSTTAKNKWDPTRSYFRK